MASPYDGLTPDKWKAKTEELIAQYPLDTKTIAEIVEESWTSIFESIIGGYAKIGTDILPTPQIMGSYLHELIPLRFAARFPDIWRKDKTGKEKDLVYIPDDKFSTEIKCSSHAKSIFANRSYAQVSTDSKKTKSGYYLAINFEKFGERPDLPRLRLIRLGWLDHSDWIGQKSPTGQQARLNPDTESLKLLRINA